MIRIFAQTSRILVGLLFIVSGFIKANDPLGFSYKLEEYFEVFGMEWLKVLALSLAILICIFEVIVGFLLLLGSRIKTTLWLLFVMIIFFTFLTFYSAYFNKVTDCGCFGDALHLTPWQSFSKDIVLLVLIIIILIGRNEINPLFGPKMENFVLSLFVIASVIFPLYTYNYLPVIDFRPYAVGKSIPLQTKGIPDQLKYYYSLKNKKTGEIKEFDKFPDNYEEQYDYIDPPRVEVVKKGVEPKILDFSIEDANKDDITDHVLSNPKYNFLLVAKDLSRTDRGVQGRIKDFVSLCQHDSIEFIALTASSPEEVKDFKHEIDAKFEFCTTDGTVLKTMIRSNPGLILLKDGVVMAQWHYHSFPSYNDVKAKYFKK